MLKLMVLILLIAGNPYKLEYRGFAIGQYKGESIEILKRSYYQYDELPSNLIQVYVPKTQEHESQRMLLKFDSENILAEITVIVPLTIEDARHIVNYHLRVMGNPTWQGESPIGEKSYYNFMWESPCGRYTFIVSVSKQGEVILRYIDDYRAGLKKEK